LFVGGYEDEEEVRREFYALLTAAQRNVAGLVVRRAPRAE
jgi:hypothetical protein